MTTYIRDRNPFRLAPPPAWWLRRLAAHDPDLVVIPSRERPLFWLARRAQMTLSFKGKPIGDVAVSPDSLMLAHHKLVNVVTMISLSWNEAALNELIGWLKRADTWQDDGRLTPQQLQQAAINGGTKLTKAIEARDAENELALARRQRETIYHATGDGWRSMQARRGARILNAGMPRPRPAAGV